MTSTRPTQFLKFVAYMQIIGIILVVFGHSFHEYPDGDGGKTLLIYQLFHSFRMPVFMFVSGYLFMFTTRVRRSDPPGVGAFARNKAMRLLLPLVVLLTLTIVPRVLLSGMADDEMSLDSSTLWRMYFYTDSMAVPVLWFLQASFLLLVVAHILLTIMKRMGLNDTIALLTLLIVYGGLTFLPFPCTSFFSIDEACNLAVYMALGATYCRFSASIESKVRLTSPVLLIGAVAAWLMLFYLTRHTTFAPLCSIAGIVMCLSVGKTIEEKQWRILDWLIGANYLIFLLHWYFCVGAQQVLHHFTAWPWWVYTILALTAGVVGPWLLHRLLKANNHRRPVRLISTLLGQKQ